MGCGRSVETEGVLGIGPLGGRVFGTQWEIEGFGKWFVLDDMPKRNRDFLSFSSSLLRVGEGGVVVVVVVASAGSVSVGFEPSSVS